MMSGYWRRYYNNSMKMAQCLRHRVLLCLVVQHTTNHDQQDHLVPTTEHGALRHMIFAWLDPSTHR